MNGYWWNGTICSLLFLKLCIAWYTRGSNSESVKVFFSHEEQKLKFEGPCNYRLSWILSFIILKIRVIVGLGNLRKAFSHLLCWARDRAWAARLFSGGFLFIFIRFNIESTTYNQLKALLNKHDVSTSSSHFLSHSCGIYGMAVVVGSGLSWVNGYRARSSKRDKKLLRNLF